MPRASSTSPLLRPPSRDVNPFNVWALTTFWGLQFIWMGLHIFLLTSGFLASNRIIQIFLVERIFIYLLSICTFLVNAFEVLVFTGCTFCCNITFSPKLYLRCNALKCVVWGISSIIIVTIDYRYRDWGFLKFRGFSILVTIISTIIFVVPTVYANDIASTIAGHQALLRYREENNIHWEEE